MAVKIPIKTEGGKQAADDLKRVGDSGQSAMDRINRSSRAPSAGLKALNGVTSELRGGLDGLSGRAGVLGRVLTGLGPLGLGAAAGIGAVAIGMGKAVTAGEALERSQLQIQAMLTATRDASGLTADQIEDMAQRVARDTLGSVNDMRTAATTLLGFTSISGDQFERTLRLAQDLSIVLGTSVTTSIQQLGQSLQSGGQNLGELQSKFKLLNEEQIDTVRSLSEAGDAAAANEIVLKALEERIGGVGSGASGGLAGAYDTLGQNVQNFFEIMADRTGAVEKATGVIGFLARSVEGVNEAIRENQELQRQGTLVEFGLAPVQPLEQSGGMLAGLTPEQYKARLAEHDAAEARRKAAEEEAEAARKYREEKKRQAEAEKAREQALRKETAELERMRRAQDAATESIEKQIEGYVNEQVALQLGGREQAIFLEIMKAMETARRAGLELTREQVTAIERETGALYDQRQALEAREKAAEEDRKTQEKAVEERKRLAEREAEAMQRPFEVAAEGVQNAFTGAFESIYSGNVKNFSDMADQIKSVFVRLAAEITTLLIFNPRASVGSLVGGMGLFGATPATAGAQMASGGGAGVSAPPGTTGLAQAGGGFGGAFMGAGMGALYGYDRGGVRGAVTGGLVGYAGGAALTAGGTALAAGWGAGASAGAGLAGASSALAAIPGWGWAALAALAIFGGGKKKPSNKSAWGGVDLLSGELSGVGSMTGDKFSQETNDARDAMLQGIAAFSASLRELTGGSLTGSVGVEVGQRDGTVVTGLGAGTYGNPQEAMDAIVQSMLGGLTGVSDEFRAVFDQIDFTDLEKGVQDLSIAAHIINREFKLAEPISEGEAAVRSITESFAALTAEAERLGINTHDLVEEQARQLRMLQEGFDTGIQDQILSILDPLEYALLEQERMAEERMTNARAVGADLVEVERLNGLERQQIVEQYANARLQAEQQAAQQQADFNFGIQNALLRRSDPLAAQLAEFDRFAEARLQQARDLGANLLAVEELNAAERADLIKDYNEATRRTITAATRDNSGRDQANAGIASYLTQLRSGSDSPLSSAARLANAEAEFDRLLGLARRGSVDARSQITGAAGNLLSASRDQFGSSDLYFQRLRFIDSTLGNLIGERNTGNTVLENIGRTISTGNAENVQELRNLNKQVAQLTATVAEQQAALNRLVNA